MSDSAVSVVETLNEHSGAVAAVRFVQDGERLALVSGGSDRTLVFRTVTLDEQQRITAIERCASEVLTGAVCDMGVCKDGDRYVMARRWCCC